MMKYQYLIFLISIFIISCKSNDHVESGEKLIKYDARKIIRIHQSKKIASIFPSTTLNGDEKVISQQIFEGLLKYNPKTLALDNCLIKNYTIDSSGTVYYFELKDSILFHNNSLFKTKEDRIVKSKDIIYCFNKLCHSNHSFSNIIKHTLTDSETELKEYTGLKQLSETRFSISLTKPNQLFVHLLAQPEAAIYPDKMINFSLNKNILKSIGTGPFIIESRTSNRIYLEKNKDYHLSNSHGVRLPLLDQIQFVYEPSIDSALALFEKGKIDLIKHLDSDVLFQLQYLQHQGKIHIDIKHQPMVSLDFISFNKTNSLSNDMNLRKGISQVLNKTQLLNQTLNGEADHPSINGFSSELFKQINYDIDQITPYQYNIDSAALYIDSIKFPSNTKSVMLLFNKKDVRHRKIATALSKQLKSLLNIDIFIKPLHQDSLETAINHTDHQLFLRTYDYDYFHPLDIMEHLAENNLVNPVALEHIDKAKYNLSKQNSLNECLIAEQSITDQYDILPLWSNEYYEVMQPDVENLYINAIKYYDFRTTFIRDIEQIKPQN